MKDTLPRRRRGLRILYCILLVLTLVGSVWFFWLPKFPFTSLTMDQIEGIYLTYEGHPEILIRQEDQEKLAGYLPQVGFEYWVSQKNANENRDGRYWKYRVVLQNGTSFALEMVSGSTEVYCLHLGFFGRLPSESCFLTFQASIISGFSLNRIQDLCLDYYPPIIK